MQNINILSEKTSELINNFSPNHIGIFFSLLLHLLILLFAIGLPDLFKPKEMILPNIVPIEIINVSEKTSLTKNINNNKNDVQEKKIVKQKKFNSSNNTEIQKIDLQQKSKLIKTNEEKEFVLNKTNEKTPLIKEKKQIEIKNNEIIPDNNFETLKTEKIKPKLKPKPKQIEINKNTDVQVEKKPINEEINKADSIIIKPIKKPPPDFSIASMLKDLRNEESNNVLEEEILKDEEIENKEDNNQESMTLSISEIDLLRQQLTSCWIAPAGAIIEKGMKVTISAKIQQNRRVVDSSVRIVDTNINKNNTFYGPITESAMRTLLNPECIPLKLPEDKFYLWKNLTITFDYSIMKGYS